MDSFENIFSIPIPTDNQIDDNWLLRVSNPNFNSTLPLSLQLLQQQQLLLQQQYHNNDNNNNNDNNINDNNTFDFQTTNTNTNSNININDIINDSMENPQIKEQLLLLQQQQVDQQQQVQQQVLDYQIQQQQSHQLRQQQFYSHDNNNNISRPLLVIPTDNNKINNNNINPVSDQQILNSMKTTEPITTTTSTTKQQPKKTTTTTITTTATTDHNNNNTGIVEDRNKIYHKKHREKKKDHVKEIEDKIAALAFENQQIAKENKSLKEHGESVDSMFLFDEESTSVCSECTEIALKMKVALENNDERNLIYLLNQFHMSMPKLILLISRFCDRTFDINVQLMLNVISYIPHTDPVSFDILTGPGSDIWIEEFKKDAKLTLDQSIKLDILRLQFKMLEDQCLAERLELDKEVKRIFNTNFMFLPKNPLEITQDDLELPYSTSNFNLPTLDLCQSLEIICKLNTLKSKTLFGRINMFQTFAKICRILTPVQEAKFLIVTHQSVTFFDSFSFQMLNLVWKNLTTSKSVFGIAEGLEHMLNTNKNNINVNSSFINNSIPFSLNPATFNFNPPNL